MLMKIWGWFITVLGEVSDNEHLKNWGRRIREKADWKE